MRIGMHGIVHAARLPHFSGVKHANIPHSYSSAFSLLRTAAFELNTPEAESCAMFRSGGEVAKPSAKLRRAPRVDPFDDKKNKKHDRYE